jgi:transcriptional regulator with XRE-family HTH domain
MSEYEVELYKIIGDMIREKRIAKGYTLDDIADKIGVTRKTVQRYETGERKIKISTLMELSEMLGFNYYEFIDQAKNKMASGVISQPHTIAQVRRVATYVKRLNEVVNGLNKDNKDKVLEFATRLYKIQQMEEPLLNAANPLPGATDDDKKHDEDLMDDF